LSGGGEQIMQAVEFDSHVKDGVITIPIKYRETITDSVRVIVFPNGNEAAHQPPKRKTKLYSMDVDMSGFKFNRNEANER
jgi:hypothetical protein